jgi:tRNA(Ile)-lysidine synthase TilS/MesJ
MEEKCFCGRPAVIVRKYEGSALCEKHFCKSVEKKVKKLIRENKMVEKGDKIAVSMSESGSYVALYMLKKIFGERKDMEIFPISEKKKYNKICMGNSLDDEIVHILTDFINGDLFRKKSAKRVIKPLRRLPENEIELYAKLNKLKFSKSKYKGLELEISNFLNEIESKSSGMKFSALTTLDQISACIRNQK